jgi:2-methylcitrate dehydratase PrpD
MTAVATHNVLTELAHFAATYPIEDMPAEVINRAQWVLRDTVGVIVGGLAIPEVSNLASFASEHYPGSSLIIGTPHRVRPEWAALVYGTAGTTLEYDEGHAFARGHAAIHAVSCGLPLASSQDVSGKDLIAAMIVGYEVAARLGVASRLRTSVHPFGAWGVIGAAAVVARLANMSSEEMRGVFDLAASYAITPSFGAAYKGANVRNTYAGMVNHNGLLAVEMYKLGFRGEPEGIPTTFGDILGSEFDEGIVADGLGERYEILRGYFKPYSACRYAHAAIDAVLALESDISLEAITRVDVETYDFAARLNDPNPQTPLAARFSIPYIVAATLHDGSAEAASFTEDAIQREAVRQLASKVCVRGSETYTAMLPHKRAARVIVHTGDSRFESEAIGSKGDPDQPMSEQELLDKFIELTEVFEPDQQHALWQRLGDITRLDSTQVLFEFIS